MRLREPEDQHDGDNNESNWDSVPASATLNYNLCVACRSRPRAWRSVRCLPCARVRRRELSRLRQIRHRVGGRHT